MFNTYRGDCLLMSHAIEPGSVDLILTDPPFGTMKGFAGGPRHDWDKVIPIPEFFEMAYRLLRPNGRLLLFGQEPFTSQLVVGAAAAVPFAYRMIWRKSSAGNHLSANTSPAGHFEDIIAFKKESHDCDGRHPARMYFQYLHLASGRSKKSIESELGGRVAHALRYDSIQFSIPTVETYSDLVAVCGVEDPMSYGALKEVDDVFREAFPSVFNLPEGKGSRSNVLEYKKDKEKLHPTQKPVALLSELIETFTNSGDTVADLTMGSGSTGVAAARTGRRFHGVEMDPVFFDMAHNRVENEYKTITEIQQERV